MTWQPRCRQCSVRRCRQLGHWGQVHRDGWSAGAAGQSWGAEGRVMAGFPASIVSDCARSGLEGISSFAKFVAVVPDFDLVVVDSYAIPGGPVGDFLHGGSEVAEGFELGEAVDGHVVHCGALSGLGSCPGNM